MRLYLAKPDLVYFEQYNEMMKEWCESRTQIAPWFLDCPLETIDASQPSCCSQLINEALDKVSAPN